METPIVKNLAYFRRHATDLWEIYMGNEELTLNRIRAVRGHTLLLVIVLSMKQGLQTTLLPSQGCFGEGASA